MLETSNNNEGWQRERLQVLRRETNPRHFETSQTRKHFIFPFILMDANFPKIREKFRKDDSN